MTPRILIVDDSAVMRALIDGTLRELGEIATVQATDGADALTKLAGVDLIVTDLTMPELDGRQLIAQVRARADASAHLPIVLLTTQSNASEATAALDGGADAYVAKPIDRARLVAVARELLARGPRRRTT